MTFLPILERELRARSRLPATFWMRAAVVAVGILVCLPQLTTSFLSPAAIGRSIFNSVLAVAFVLGCCACFLTADSVSSERREGTLGFLLLTRVKVFDILLAKVGSIGLTSLCALVAFAPFLMLPLLVGGVTGGEAFRQMLALLNAVWFSLIAGLWSSAGEEHFGRAARRAAALMLAVLLIPLCIREFMSKSSFLGLFSPVVSLLAATDFNYITSASASRFWTSLLLVQVLTWVLLVSAVFRLRRSWAAEARPAPEENTLPPARRIPAPGRPRRELTDELGPVRWLYLRQRGIKPALWTAAILTLITQILPLAFVLRFAGSWGYYIPSLAFSLLSGGLVSWAASRFLVEAARTGQLELLLTTPAGAEKIISEQWRILKRLLLFPVILMCIPVLIRAYSVFIYSTQISGMSAVYSPASLLLQVGNTLLSIYALCWLGMFYALRTRSQAAAVIWSVALARGLPYIFALLCQLLLVPVSRKLGMPTFYSSIYLVIPALTMAGLIGLTALAKRGLQNQIKGGAGELQAKDVFLQTGKIIDEAVRKFRHWTPG